MGCVDNRFQRRTKTLAIGCLGVRTTMHLVLLCSDTGRVAYSRPIVALNTGDCPETFVETREKHNLHPVDTGKGEVNKENVWL